MIILGDEIVPYEALHKVNCVQDVANTPANSTVLFPYNKALMQYCAQNSVPYAVQINEVKEGIYANALKARYIIASFQTAKQIQLIAENYMYDAKVLCIIDSNNELEKIAKAEIDGVVYSSIL
ncbi:hypothetical protein [Candidatus Marinarcus aquaticus]|uniref:GP-PDE domain-containing protein n=1 Tax=Candidatus Marinarcus aquaticus TaxID=2044504 RepID=A0A4Q0XRZ5_9BACT|nr:hypothetical protein [Candidatus Marinarcus aquaticus]RXJ60250.1 hypothetical protein CRV04_04400 [Candidatus Marinarcus aquaticus]